MDGLFCNADMRPEQIRKFCALDESGERIIRSAMAQMQLSARAYHRVLKLARTIADLAGSNHPAAPPGRSTSVPSPAAGDGLIIHHFA